MITFDRRLDRDGAIVFYYETEIGMDPVAFALWVAASYMSYDQQVVAVLAYCIAVEKNPEAALRVLDERRPTRRRTLGVKDLPPSGLTPAAFARRLNRSLLSYDQLIAAVLAYCLGLGKRPERAFWELDQPQPAPDLAEEVPGPVDADEVEETSFSM